LETRAPQEDGTAPSKNPPVPDGLASQPTLSRFVAMLSTEHNRATLRLGLLQGAARRIRALRRGHRFRYLTLDLDSLPIEVHGEQPGSEYNGHYHGRIYHPLIASVAETGDLLDVKLREGNAHTAQGGLDFLLPLLDKVELELCQVAAVRIDAGFPDEPSAIRTIHPLPAPENGPLRRTIRCPCGRTDRRDQPPATPHHPPPPPP